MNTFTGVRTTTPNRRIVQLIGITVGVTVAIFVAPSTGWLARLEVYNAFHHGPRGTIQGYLPLPATVQRDRDVRLVNAEDLATLFSLDRGGRVDALHRLAVNYPDSPAVYGTAIIDSLIAIVHCNRFQDERPLAYDASQSDIYKPDPMEPASSPSILAAYDTDCAAGERTDPNNAFFPAFRAYGLFAQHRDKDAIAELLKAGDKPFYNDYRQSELDGLLKIDAARDGGKEAIHQTSEWASILLPHFSRIRDVARLSIALAIGDELRGDTEGGFRIRRAVRRFGGLMRFGGQYLISSLVGRAIVNYAATKPDGIIPPGYAHMKTADASVREKAQDDVYTAYLSRIGHPEEASAFTREMDAGDRVKSLIRSEVGFVDPCLPVKWVAVLWVASLLLVWCTFSVMWFGIGALALGRLPAIRYGTGFTSLSLRSGLTLGLITSIVALASWIAGSTIPGTETTSAITAMATGLPAAVGVCMAAFGLWRRWKPADYGRFLGTAVLTMCAMGIMLWPLACLSTASSRPDEAEMVQLLSPNSNSDSFPMLAAFIIAYLIIPVLAVLTAMIFLRRGRPASVAAVTTLRNSTLPLCCILLLAYALLVCVTARQETVNVARMKKAMGSEGRYYASMAHQPWPGKVN